MSEEKTTLADFFKAISEEKKRTEISSVEETIVEQKTNDMSDYLSALQGKKSFIPEMIPESPV
jgi:hypothetical protein